MHFTFSAKNKYVIIRVYTYCIDCIFGAIIHVLLIISIGALHFLNHKEKADIKNKVSNIQISIASSLIVTTKIQWNVDFIVFFSKKTGNTGKE